MKLSKTATYILTGLIIGTLAVAGIYVYNQQNLLRMLKVSYYRAQVVKANLAKFTVDLYLWVTNFSDVDVNVDSYNMIVYINNRPITRVVSKIGGYIPASAKSPLKITFEMNVQEALKNLFTKEVFNSILFDYSKVIVRLKGVISANHKGIAIKDFPVDISDSLNNLVMRKPELEANNALN